MDVNIYPADKSDLSEILQLQKQCYQSEAVIYNDDNIPPLRQDMDALEKEFSEQLFLKAVAEDEIVGSVRAFFDGKTCFVGKLIVKTDFQNRGIGKLLLDAIETDFPTSKRFELFTGHKSLKNLHLYGKQGYNVFCEKIISNNMTIIYLEKLK